jgi:hypothetical protein
MGVTKTETQELSGETGDSVVDHENLATALAGFHSERPRVVKDSDDTHYGRRYASLDAFEAVVLPVLAKHGLTWMILPGQLGPEGVLIVQWQLVHGASGEKLEGTWPLVQGSPQQVGSSLTYAKRYLLSAVTGVSADDDDNGAAAEKASQGAPTEKDWLGVIEKARGLADQSDVEALRRLWGREDMKHAPQEAQDAFTAEVKRASTVVVESPGVKAAS